MMYSPHLPSVENKESQRLLLTTRGRSGLGLVFVVVYLFFMDETYMLLVKGVPRGRLQTSSTEELPTHDCGLHKDQISQNLLHGSLHFFPKGMIVLSLYHSMPRATWTVSRGLKQELLSIHSCYLFTVQV